MPHSQEEWSGFFSAVHRRCGVDLSLYKPAQLQRRVIGIAGSKGIHDLKEFSAWLDSDREAMTWFMDRLAINVSELFRNPDRWVDLEERVLPVLLERHGRLKAWSAGCSYGAEAYSLAAILAKRFPGPHKVIGTDIDQAALTQAREGIFSEADARRIPEAYRDAFVPIDGRWRAVPELRRYLDFRSANLLSGPFESGFDLIMCRNVVIYFSDEAKSDLYQRFFDALSPGGFLFVGGTERIFNAREIGFDTALPFFYRKPPVGDLRAWRNAS